MNLIGIFVICVSTALFVHWRMSKLIAGSFLAAIIAVVLITGGAIFLFGLKADEIIFILIVNVFPFALLISAIIGFIFHKLRVRQGKTGFDSGLLATSIYSVGSFTSFAIWYSLINVPSQTHLPMSPFVLSILITVPILLCTGVIGRYFGQRYKKANQKQRDARAKLILEQAKRGLSGDYSLYLRSFITDGKMPIEDTSDFIQNGFDPRIGDENLSDFVSLIAKVVEAEAPLVTLGRPDEQFGAGRIETKDDYWRDDLKILSNNALLIFILPSSGPNLLWEVKWVKLSGYLRKTIFFMPPKKSRFMITPKDSEELIWEETWNMLIPKMQEIGVKLPNYQKGGMLFFFDKNGEIASKVNLGGNVNLRFISETIGNLLEQMRQYAREKNK